MEIKGQIEEIVFSNEMNSYTVCNMVVENNIIFTEYQPILMENGFGKNIDFNVLHSKNTRGIKKAPTFR